MLSERISTECPRVTPKLTTLANKDICWHMVHGQYVTSSDQAVLRESRVHPTMKPLLMGLLSITGL
jgi:hypothetical protein